MEKKEPQERLREARLAAGYKFASEAAKRLGVTITTYRTHENGQNQIPYKRAEQYAKLFKVTPEWILYGRGSAETIRVPVLGTIIDRGNAVTREMQSENNVETIEVPVGIGSDCVAVRVVGDGMYPRYSDGDILVYGPESSYEDAYKKECMVLTQGGDRLLRTVGLAVGDGKVMLESWNNTAITERVVEYRRILWVMRTA